MKGQTSDKASFGNIFFGLLSRKPTDDCFLLLFRRERERETDRERETERESVCVGQHNRVSHTL